MTILASMAIPSALTGYCFRRLEHAQNKREKELAEKENLRETQMNLILRATRASISLGEATAIALKNGKTNGETEAALIYAKQVKHEQDDFLTETASKALV